MPRKQCGCVPHGSQNSNAAQIVLTDPTDDGTINWTINFPNPTNFLIQYSFNGTSDWTLEQTQPGNIRTLNIANDAYYRVVASGGANDGVISNVVYDDAN